MKMKLYYGALALLWLLSSCTPKHELDSIVKAAVKEAMQC